MFLLCINEQSSSEKIVHKNARKHTILTFKITFFLEGIYSLCTLTSWPCPARREILAMGLLVCLTGNDCVAAADDPTQRIPVNVRGSPSKGFDVEYVTRSPGNFLQQVG